jgi:hypothetical protein
LLARIAATGCALAGLALNTHQAAAATLPARQPGLWQSTTFGTLSDGTKLQGGKPVITVSCVDPATDLKFFTFKGSACSGFTISGSGTSYTISGDCKQGGKTVKIITNLFYLNANTVELVGTVDPGTGPVHLNAELKWQGPCLPGMAPGDEGDIENGAFVKTDNINDSDNQ